MAATNPGRLKKWVYVALCLLIVPALFTIIFTVNCAKEPETVVASQEIESDANKAPAEPSRQSEQEQKDPNDKLLLRLDHKHPAFAERIEERTKMVAWQIQARDVKDPNVLKAMRIVPRHAFVRSTEQRYAYTDNPLPIGFDQTISQPYIVAFMTEALKLRPDSKVLEIGTGSGYQAAVCAEIAKEVYTIEIVEGLANRAEKCLKELGYPNVFVRFGDGFFGWPDVAPFDAIIGTAAAGRIPEPLLEQLKPGGRMILPYGRPWDFQYLVLITKDEKGNLHKSNVMPVRFVPMTGEVMKPEKESEK
ncbi:MAG TPA: protein-L-isoaspartate(D-aspartate) O-methyltransferase [Sedimentisphaerales bacterium]|nr:protein-L-isoaspartate(D-aspartate) O-methyltransferase [Sedimentisphaerales bacterium]